MPPPPDVGGRFSLGVIDSVPHEGEGYFCECRFDYHNHGGTTVIIRHRQHDFTVKKKESSCLMADPGFELF